MLSKLLALLALLCASCIIVGQTPRDIIGGSPYCEARHPDVYMCRDDYTRVWKCVNTHGRWQCWRIAE